MLDALRNLGVRLPVLAAPMSGGAGTPELVLAAARAGSFGFLAGGYKTPSELEAQLTQVREASVPFGVNLFAPNPLPVDAEEFERYAAAIQPDADRFDIDLGAMRPREDEDWWEEKVELLISDPVPVVSFTFGIPEAGVLERLRRAGSTLIQTITSPEEAHRAEEAGVDALVVQSSMAGGHWGTLTPGASPGRSELQKECEALDLPRLIAAVGAASELPLLAAGGISSHHLLDAALAAGASAAIVGTALMLSPEAGTSPTHREALIAAAADSGRETVQTRAFTGRPARGLSNEFIEAHESEAPIGYPAIHHLTIGMRKAAAAAGDAERLHLWAGTGFREARAEPAAATLERLAPGG
jgi:NAD(P)H-dependent flavin oxidoreductase YrpB (nitropropane dioxygenase family)